jgi:hypothetical protein
LNYGVRYDYYTPIREANNLQVKFNVDTGVIDPNTTPVFRSTKTNFQPRFGTTFSATEKTIIRAGFGMFVGPGQTEDQVQTIADSDRVSVTLSSGAALAYPAGSQRRRRRRSSTIRTTVVPAACLPERVHDSGARLAVHDFGPAGSRWTHGGDGGVCRRAGTQPVPAEHRESDRQRRHQPESGKCRARHPAILDRAARRAGAIIGVQNPYAEIDTKTSGGHDNLQRAAARPFAPVGRRPVVNAQYTLSRSFGNTSGSNEALTVGNAPKRWRITTTTLATTPSTCATPSRSARCTTCRTDAAARIRHWRRGRAARRLGYRWHRERAKRLAD